MPRYLISFFCFVYAFKEDVRRSLSFFSYRNKSFLISRLISFSLFPLSLCHHFSTSSRVSSHSYLVSILFSQYLRALSSSVEGSRGRWMFYVPNLRLIGEERGECFRNGSRTNWFAVCFLFPKKNFQVMVRSILLRGFDQDMAERIRRHMMTHEIKFIKFVYGNFSSVFFSIFMFVVN